MVERIEYLKTKFQASIAPEIFDSTISSLYTQSGTIDRSFPQWWKSDIFPIAPVIKELCDALAQTDPELIQDVAWVRMTDGSAFPLDRLSSMAQSLIVVQHRKDLLQIFSPWWLFFTQYQLECEKALHASFPDLQIPCNVPITISFNGVELDRTSREWILNPTKKIRFEKTKFRSYEEAAKKIIDLLDQESFIEHNMFYMSGSYHRLDINAINISADTSQLPDKDEPSFETRTMIVNRIKKMLDLIDLDSSSVDEEEWFDTVYDAIKELQESKKCDASQKEYIFSKVRGMMINRLGESISTLCTGYGMFQTAPMTIEFDADNESEDDSGLITGRLGQGVPQPELYAKYDALYKLNILIKEYKNTDDVYAPIDQLLNLLHHDKYHDLNYDTYREGYIADTQKCAINYCEALKMIKNTTALQKF